MIHSLRMKCVYKEFEMPPFCLNRLLDSLDGKTKIFLHLKLFLMDENIFDERTFPIRHLRISEMESWASNSIKWFRLLIPSNTWLDFVFSITWGKRRRRRDNKWYLWLSAHQHVPLLPIHELLPRLPSAQSDVGKWEKETQSAVELL